MAGELVAVGLGILAVVAVVVASLRWSERMRAQEHEGIHAFNGLLARVAKSRSLSCRVPKAYVHPAIGSAPCYGVLSGTIDGLELSLSAERIGGPDNPDDRVELVLNAKDSDTWAERASSTRAKASDVGPEFIALSESAELLEVGAGRLRVRPRCSPSGSSQHVMQWLFKRDEELVDFLDLAVRACGELRAR